MSIVYLKIENLNIITLPGRITKPPASVISFEHEGLFRRYVLLKMENNPWYGFQVLSRAVRLS